MPKTLSYSLRFPGGLRSQVLDEEKYNWQTDRLFSRDPFPIRYPDENDGGPPSYHKEGFLAIQNAIANTFITYTKNSTAYPTIPKILVNRFPYPSHFNNPFVTQMEVLLPLFFLLSLNYTFVNTVRFISIEKEKQLKEAMKIMGLASWMHYLSWFIRTIIMLFITMLLVTLLLTVTHFFFSYLFMSMNFFYI